MDASNPPERRPVNANSTGTVARVDRATKIITKRLNRGEIAIIDHSDLDRVSAEELIRRKISAVVNVSMSITGRYPNLGPQLLLDAGIPVIDGVGPDVMVRVTDGAVVRLRVSGDEAWASPAVLDEDRDRTQDHDGQRDGEDQNARDDIERT